ncbi:MAG TPA: sigma-70 family RNA polymerase sigma factor [Thermoanaerobaculia bacterium]|nr:sigma-70 family RNA polymerase sigma factor [Thermoanaerobaculia bacterium]
MTPESLYHHHLPSIERIANAIAHKKRLNPDDCTEFVQHVRVRLFDDNYAILRKFEGRSAITTYLTTVIGRLYNEWRDKLWGKWRPSAEARRLGDLAITLERMLTRDGLTYSEAVDTLTTRSGPHPSVAELEALYVRLPLRGPRPMRVSEDVLPDVVAVPADADDRVASGDCERTARRVAEIIDSVFDSFGPEDRLILRLRFWKSCTAREISEVVKIDPKKIFKRLEKLFKVLRRALETAGVSAADIALLLARGDHEIHLDVLKAGENGTSGPSNDKGKDGRGGKRRRLR